MFKTTDLSSLLNGFIRNILPSKPGGLITTPFWSYIIISQSGADPRRKSLQESMGAWGAKSSRPNPDKSFVTPVYVLQAMWRVIPFGCTVWLIDSQHYRCHDGVTDVYVGSCLYHMMMMMMDVDD